MPCTVDYKLLQLCHETWAFGPITPGRQRVHTALGIEGTHFPTDYSASANVGDFSFTVREEVSGTTQTVYGRRRLPFQHRVMALCPSCERWIPIGRMQQHAGKGLGRRGPRKPNGRFSSATR